MTESKLAELIIETIEAHAPQGCAEAERLGISPLAVDVAQHALRCSFSRGSLNTVSRMLLFHEKVHHGNGKYETALKEAALSVISSAARAAVVIAAIDMAINSHAKSSAQKAN